MNETKENEYIRKFTSENICFDAVKFHYGGRKAQRSGVPLITHIVEGLKILTRIGTERVINEAWCLHPIVQSDGDLRSTLRRGFLVKLGNSHVQSILYAMEYRAVANSYLSNMTVDIDDIRTKVNAFSGIHKMLIADKIQNWKDFSAQPKGTYDNEEILHKYFHSWCYDILGLTESEVEGYMRLIDDR